MNWLADTNVISELSRRCPNDGVVVWAGRAGPVSVSAVTVEEIFFGLSWSPNAAVQRWFERYFLERADVLPVTAKIARLAGDLRGALRARGKVRSQADMLIAATAAVHGLILATRNVHDFENCGIKILNPFT